MDPTDKTVVAALGLGLVTIGLVFFARNQRPSERGVSTPEHSLQYGRLKFGFSAPASVILILIGVATTIFPFTWESRTPVDEAKPSQVTPPPSASAALLPLPSVREAFQPTTMPTLAVARTAVPASAAFVGAWSYSNGSSRIVCGDQTSENPTTGGGFLLDANEEGKLVLAMPNEDGTIACRFGLSLNGTTATLDPGQSCGDESEGIVPTVLTLNVIPGGKLRAEISMAFVGTSLSAVGGNCVTQTSATLARR